MKVLNIVILGALIACNPNKSGTETQDIKQPDVEAVSVNNCYQFANENDTISLKLIHVKDSISGTLIYNLKEKDTNKGTIHGAMTNNLLVADYTFMSEGIQSVRQVAFKLEGTTFIEGYGENVHESDKMKFKNLDSLSFSGNIKLAEIACE